MNSNDETKSIDSTNVDQMHPTDEQYAEYAQQVNNTNKETTTIIDRMVEAMKRDNPERYLLAQQQGAYIMNYMESHTSFEQTQNEWTRARKKELEFYISKGLLDDNDLTVEDRLILRNTTNS
jgi:hypothetical protein